ncbi:SDHD, membrane anchor subunit of succinate dehydrogenase [Athelia psychrophila]|uniref:Succinate dehydrogenase [ubiquinone] cytochrome b small subunit n=1 Tax=Athelia psychrophila TaxID=1759441 RepID=A0A166P9C1_9AGAM|nr:SDHD, membrane anchor subunit of succinate dehydrogenase [Fibularhizoctonia sp. CBS 109695]
MSSAFLLRSTLPRTFKAASGRSALLAAVQARHASTSTTPYVPGGPIIQGTVNDPTTFPESDRSHGSYHWAFERLLSAGLVPLTAAAFVTSGSNYPILDGILGVSLIMHSHIGFDSILVDYVHKRKFPILGPVSTWGLRTVTVGVLVGVYSFNTNDIGLTELITKVWHA